MRALILSLEAAASVVGVVGVVALVAGVLELVVAYGCTEMSKENS